MSISDWQRATAFPATAMGTLETGVRPWQPPIYTFGPIDLKWAIGWHKHSFFECGGVWPKFPLWCKITHLLHIMMIIIISTVISVTMVSCIVLRSFFLINCKICLKDIQPTSRFLLLVWWALRIEKLSVFIFPLLRCIVESKKVSEKQRKSKLWVLLKVSIKGALIKSWDAWPFTSQWKN